MKTLTLMTLLATQMITLTALGGNGGVSGGDPRVAEFLGGANYFCQWLTSSKALQTYSSACAAEVEDLYQSVNNIQRKARLEFGPNPVFDSNGVSKDVVTDVPLRTIHGNIDRWQSQTFSQRMITVAMEMALLLDIKDRYTLADCYKQTSLFGGDLNPNFKASFLPVGTRFVAVQRLVVPANSTAIGFVNGTTIPVDSFGYGSYHPGQLAKEFPGVKSGCVFSPRGPSASNRKISELTILEVHSGGLDTNFAVASPKTPAKSYHYFSCWKISPDDSYLGGWNWSGKITMGEMLKAIGNQFHIILPNDQDL